MICGCSLRKEAAWVELIERLRTILRNEYGITSDEELLKALDEQERMDIGIFVSPCGMEEGNVQAVG